MAEEEGKQKKHQKHHCTIRFNPYCPEAKTKPIVDEKLKERISNQLPGMDIDFNNFPFANIGMIKRNMDVCMKCGKATYTLTTHFKEVHPNELENIHDYKLWSDAKKMQAMLHPSINVEEIDEARTKGTEYLVELFERHGITVLKKDDNVSRFKIGDSLPTLKKNLEPLTEEFRQQWRALVMANISSDEAPQLINWKNSCVPGSLLSALSNLEETTKIPNLKALTITTRKQKQKTFFSNCGAENNVVSFQKELFLKRSDEYADIKKLPLLEKLETCSSEEKFSQLIEKYSDKKEEKEICAFYSLLIASIFSIDDNKKRNSITRKCIANLSYLLWTLIEENDAFPEAKTFYADKPGHLTDLSKGRPKEIHQFDLPLLCHGLGVNMIFTVESKKCNTTLCVKPLDDKKNRENVICFGIDIDSNDIKLIRSMY